MYNRDVFSLSKMKYKGARKSYRFIAVTYIISLVLFTVFFYMYVSFEQSVNNIIKENEIMLSIHLNASKKENILNLEDDYIGKEYDVLFECVSITHTRIRDESGRYKIIHPYITIGDKTVEYKYSTSDNIYFYDKEIYSNYTKKYFKNRYNINGFIAGDKAVESNEIVVSEELLNNFGINPYDAIGKKLSYKYNANEYISNFTIVGVIAGKNYSLPIDCDNDALIYLPLNAQTNLPQSVNASKNYNAVYDLNSVKKVYELEAMDLRSNPSLSISSLLNEYENIKPTFNIICKTLLTCAVMVFVVSLLNIFITEKHLHNLKKDYIYMCYVNGMRKKDIYKEYLFQNVILLTIPFIIYVIISLGLCIGSMYGINLIMEKILEGRPISIKTDLSLYPVIIVLVAIINIVYISIISLMSIRVKKEE